MMNKWIYRFVLSLYALTTPSSVCYSQVVMHSSLDTVVARAKTTQESIIGFKKTVVPSYLRSGGDEEKELVEVEEEIPYTDVIDYCGNYIYENGTLRKILVEGGYITFDSSNQPVYHFYLKDHLGNNRVVANASGQVEQVNHYYPYGGLMEESTGGDVQRYKYNGKELDRMLGLDWYDYGARHYDGALTMWGTMDPLCEKYYNISPYVYCGNNPINAFDPDGRVVHPADSNALAILHNTISPEDREFIVINENGNIDYVTMQSHKSESQNYTELMDLVSADIIYNIYVQTEYSYMDNVGNIKSSSLSYSEPDIEFADPDFLSPSGLTTGEAGKYGITLLPGRGKSGVNSPNQDAHIYIHPSLSPLGQAEALSHELYGHGFLYNQYRDRRVSGHDYRKTSRDHNDLLRNNIKRARMETVSYFK